MEVNFKETKDLLEKEHEVAKKVVEHVPVIQEMPVVDSVLEEKLTAGNENLMVNWPGHVSCFLCYFSDLTFACGDFDSVGCI
ncbi:hypothetical protein SOVF_200420 [Spinacia oleracea]|nr:hypothetical protein SOVF_200420 [Spinacia oleracea]